MKKLIIIILISIFSSSVHAEWTKILTASGGSNIYLDKRTVKVDGSTKYFYFMVDYSKPDPQGTLSAKIYTEVNCSNMMMKRLILDYFKYPLGEGDSQIGSGPKDNPEWRYYPPDSVFGALNKYVCDM